MIAQNCDPTQSHPQPVGRNGNIPKPVEPDLFMFRGLGYLIVTTGLAACASTPAEEPAQHSPEAPVVYAIPAPPSPNPLKKKSEPKEDQPAKATEQAARKIAFALTTIKENYVDPVDDARLIGGCRESLLAIGGDRPAAAQQGVGGTTELRQLVDTFLGVQSHEAEKIEDDKIADACIRGMMRTLDHSEFIDKEEFTQLQSGSYDAGIGIEVESVPVSLVVVSTIEGAPASKTDIRKGDIITEIDGVILAPLPRNDAFKRLRGKPDSTMSLTVERQGRQEPLRVTLIREVVRVNSVGWTLLSSGYVYIRISLFTADTVAKLVGAIRDAYAINAGTEKGLILDLRNNFGGLLHVCVGVSATFLPPDLLIAGTEGRSKDSAMRLYSSRPYYVRAGKDPLESLPLDVKKVPVVVLVNRLSASGTEVVAAALQDHKRAKVLGQRTFGHNLVHTILPIGDGSALKLATARFYRASGKPIGDGVEPDVLSPSPADAEVYPVSRAGEDPVVRFALSYLAATRQTSSAHGMESGPVTSGDYGK